MKFTTSWDDGYALDLRLADLLEQYNCTGTFYVCPQKQHGHTMLEKKEIAQLSTKHEIGAHTLLHPKLPNISSAEARTEITGSKQWIEDVIGKECTAFCYPYGMWNTEVRNLVEEAGFAFARTTERLEFTTKDPFLMPTTLQVTPFPKRKTFKKLKHVIDPYGPLRVRRRKLKSLGIGGDSIKSWLNLATALFDYGLANNQPVFHLWGHSHELEKYNMWGELEEFLTYVENSGVQSVKNSDTLDFL